MLFRFCFSHHHRIPRVPMIAPTEFANISANSNALPVVNEACKNSIEAPNEAESKVAVQPALIRQFRKGRYNNTAKTA